jgi:hypothetical protein
MKYTVIYVSGVATRVAIPISPGYSEGVIEPFFPSDEELLKMNRKQVREWTQKNNRRMRAICKFLNENNL